MKLSKDEIAKKGQAYLKSSNKEACIVTEDGTVFESENERYAKAHGAILQRSDKSCTGAITTVNSGKAGKADTAPEAKPEKAKTSKKAGKK